MPKVLTVLCFLLLFLSFFSYPDYWSGHGTEVYTFQVPHYPRSNSTFQADTIICYRLFFAAFLPQSISSEVSAGVFSSLGCSLCHYMPSDWRPHHTGGSGECDHNWQPCVVWDVIVEVMCFFLLTVWSLWRGFFKCYVFQGGLISCRNLIEICLEIP